MKLGITGHRPQKLYGFDESHPGNTYVINAIGNYLKKLEPEKVYLGMAIGSDQWAARWCVMLNIPFVGVIPFEHQDQKWPPEVQKMYRKLRKKAESIHTVSESTDENVNDVMQRRNMYIVDHSDQILGIFGGCKGGTQHCLEYAQRQNKPIDIISPGLYYQS